MENDIRKIFIKYKESYEGRWNNLNKIINLEKNEDVIVRELLTLFEVKLANSEAKVYAYEKIIANSNFKVVLEKPKKESDKK